MEKQSTAKQRKKQFKRIIEIIKRNPQKGLCAFYSVYGRLLNITAETFTKQEKNEVVNEVMIKIWKNAETIGEIDNPEGWIYTMTANCAKDILKGKYTYKLDEDVAASTDEIQEIADTSSFYWLIKDLTELEQSIMIYKFVAQNTFQEFADDSEKSGESR